MGLEFGVGTADRLGPARGCDLAIYILNAYGDVDSGIVPAEKVATKSVVDDAYTSTNNVGCCRQ